MKNKKIKDFLEITIGIIIISIGYYFFLLPAKLVTGGIMGISIIIEDVFHYSPSSFLYVCYAILLTLGGLLLGKDFFIKSLYGALLQPTVVFILEQIVPADYFINMVENQSNVLFVAMIFAPLIYGTGIGLLFKHNATTGGMDAVQKIMNKYLKLPLSMCIYISDGIVILLGIFAFGIERGTFALVTMFLIGKIVDLVCLGGKSKNTVEIITSKPEEIKNMIYTSINRGVTEMNVQGGYSKENKKLLLCVLSNREYIKIKELVYEIDPFAFMIVSSANEVLGRGFTLDKFS